MLFVWDFVLDRDDGSSVFLHPNWSSTKIACSWSRPVEDLDIPKTGLGGTNVPGSGTFKYFKNKQVDEQLRFDPSKSVSNGMAQFKRKKKPQSRSNEAYPSSSANAQVSVY